MWSESIIERTVQGLGYELVDVEWAGGGVLRVYIDNPKAAVQDGGAMQGGVTVDDCARVSEQLSRVFTVENVNYERLEISSPGLDRPLKKAADFARFVGEQAQVKLRSSPPGAPRGRKQFKGVLQSAGSGGAVAANAEEGPARRFGLMLDADEAGASQLVEFSVDEVEKARLVPQVNLKAAANGAKGAGAKRAGQKAAEAKAAVPNNVGPESAVPPSGAGSKKR